MYLFITLNYLSVLIVIPLVLVSFMEGYSAAHRIALQKHELHFLNPSQELFATGSMSMLGCFT